jgi:hypothetical protein
MGNVKDFDKWSLMPLIPAWVLVVLEEYLLLLSLFSCPNITPRKTKKRLE